MSGLRSGGILTAFVLSASDCGAHASKRVGRKTDARRSIHTAVHNSHNPGRRRRRSELAEAERKTQDAAAVAARNCNSARERDMAQPYLFLRSNEQHFQTRMRILPIL